MSALSTNSCLKVSLLGFSQVVGAAKPQLYLRTILLRKTNTEPMNVERHGVYFWDLVTFKVDNRLFRVPKHPFISGSPVFSDKHGILNVSILGDEGLTSPLCRTGKPAQEGHIYLSGVTVTEFEVLLRFMFPEPASHLVKPSTHGFSKDEWLVILKLSTAWHFIEYRKLAIERLSTAITNPIELIAVAREHGVSKWLVSGYQALVEREDVMTEEAGLEIGVLVAFRICLLRESYARSKSTKSPSSLPARETPDASLSLSHRIRTTFLEELAAIAEREQEFKTKEEKEADEKARRERERLEEEARLERSKEEKEEKRRLELEGEKAKLAEAEEALRIREAKLQLERRELEKKAAQFRATGADEAFESKSIMSTKKKTSRF